MTSAFSSGALDSDGKAALNSTQKLINQRQILIDQQNDDQPCHYLQLQYAFFVRYQYLPNLTSVTSKCSLKTKKARKIDNSRSCGLLCHTNS